MRIGFGDYPGPVCPIRRFKNIAHAHSAFNSNDTIEDGLLSINRLQSLWSWWEEQSPKEPRSHLFPFKYGIFLQEPSLDVAPVQDIKLVLLRSGMKKTRFGCDCRRGIGLNY